MNQNIKIKPWIVILRQMSNLPLTRISTDQIADRPIPCTDGALAGLYRVQIVNYFENVCRLAELVRQRGLTKEPEVIAILAHLKQRAVENGDATAKWFDGFGDAEMLNAYSASYTLGERSDVVKAWDDVIVGDLLHLLELRDSRKATILAEILDDGWIACAESIRTPISNSISSY